MRTQTIRAFFERGCFAGWMFALMVNTIILGLALELFIFGTLFSFDDVLLINEQTAPLLVWGVFAIFTLPLVVRFWQFGVENLNFEIHESAFNRMIEPPQAWSNAVLALLDESGNRSSELEILVRLIDEAPGAVERQERRAEAKVWLKANREKLSDEDKEFVKEYLGYLH